MGSVNKKVPKSFVSAWETIDGIIDTYQEIADELMVEVNSIAANESIWKACLWLEGVRDTYGKLSKYPSLRFEIEKKIKALTRSDGAAFAHAWFRDFEIASLRLNTSFLTVESNRGELVDEAQAMGDKCRRLMMDELGRIRARGASGKYCMKSAERLARAICAGAGIDYPSTGDVEGCEKAEMAAVCARLFDAKFWRRRLSKLQGVKLEMAARSLGMVCKRRGGYCSDVVLRRRFGQRKRNRELLEMLEAENELGDTYTLAELADKSVSNAVVKRAELMTRLRGFEELGDELAGYMPVFITQTAPSRFHSHSRCGAVNPHWNGSTPKDAQAYLSCVWAKTRAAWDRHKITAFGFRVAEPHHDGCPHWHLLLWIPKHQFDTAVSIYGAYAMEDTPPARMAVRFKVMVDELASGAVNYIAKYISKNIDGMTADGKEWSKDAVSTALRTDAWASTWSIRQFQQIGGASVTVYREMWRIADTVADSREIENIRLAVKENDWKQFTIEMGGVECGREDRPLRACMVKKKDEAGEFIRNAYGELMRSVWGLEAYGWLPIKTRFHEWVVKPIKRGVKSFKEAHAPPWTCVNNCTG